MRLIDSVTQQLLVIMQTQLPAKLTEIEIEYNDGVILQAPRNYIDYMPAPEDEPRMPLVIVLAGPTRFDVDTGFAGTGFADAVHEIVVVAVLEDSDPRILRDRLIRYQRALIEVCGSNRVVPGSWHGLNVESAEPGERFSTSGPGGPYGDTMSVMLRVRRTEQ